MSFKECIIKAESDGSIDRDQATYIRDLFDAIELDKSRSMGPASAEAEAAAEVAARLAADAAQAKRIKYLKISAWDHATAELNQTPGRPGAALKAQAVALEHNITAVRNQLIGGWDQGVAKMSRSIIGRSRDKVMQAEMVRAAYGGKVSDTAKIVFEQFRDTAEMARRRANSAGMRIAKMDNWRLPQRHEARLIRASNKNEWIEYVAARVDMAEMRDGRTGLPFNPQTLRAALAETHDNILDGHFSRPSATGGRGRSLANQRMDHRFIVFKDADSWLEYNARFGGGDIFETLVGHISSMSRDIAMLERFGPDPASMVRGLGDYTAQRAARTNDQKLIDQTAGDIDTFGRMFDYLRHGERIANPPVAMTLGAVRDILSSSLLGGAPISALADLNTQAVAARMTGTPFSKIVRSMFANMPAGEEQRAYMARIGLVAEETLFTGTQTARFLGEGYGPNITRVISDATHRLSGLTGWTRSARQAFGSEFMIWMGDNAGKTFDDLDKPLQQTLTRNGITPAEWDVARVTPLYRDHKYPVDMLRMTDIGDRADLPLLTRRRLQTKMMSMVEREMDLAVPMPNIESRFSVTAGTSRGTLGGEILRAVGMFKQFPVTIMLGNLRTYMNVPGKMNKTLIMAQFALLGTALGAGIIQAKQMIYGREPRPMDEPSFWLASMLQFGGLGILGDFLFQNLNRFGRGIEETLAGPMATFGTHTVNLTVGNLMQAVEGEDTDFGREFVEYARRYLPGSSIWYARLGLERAVDQMMISMDPSERRRLRKRARRYEKAYGSGYWWAPGEGPKIDKLVGN
tara:strand:+ start:1648 stop:4053 length:2406 start_codon:yes stop_codon:yes gene_type:complete